MKKIISILLAVIICTLSMNGFSVTSHAAATIPKAYISGSTGYGNGHKVTISLTSPATESTTVYYRTVMGSANNLTTVVSTSKFIDANNGSVTFNTGESSKTVTITGYDPSSYEEAQRYYMFQIYRTLGNAVIDKNNDFIKLYHNEDYATLSAGDHVLAEDGNDYRLEDSGDTVRLPSGGVTWQNTSNYNAKYWPRIGVNNYSMYMYGDIYTDDGNMTLYFDINGSSDGYNININGDGWNDDGWTSGTRGPRTVDMNDKIEATGIVQDAAGSDYGLVGYYKIYGHPNDTDDPDVAQVLYNNGNYGAGQQIVISLVFDEIVRVNGSHTGEVKLPVICDDGSEIYAVYDGGSGTDILVFRLDVPAGKKASQLKFNSNCFYGEGYVTDIAGNTFNQSSFESKLSSYVLSSSLKFDGTTPTITNISADKSNVALRDGGYIDITLTFDRAVRMLGDVSLTLNNGATAIRTKTSADSTSHTFRYNVGSSTANDISNLYVTGISGATVVDDMENTGYVFPSGTNISGQNITIDNTPPVLSVQYMDTASTPANSHKVKVTATDNLSGINTDNTYQYGFSSGSYTDFQLLGQEQTISGEPSRTLYLKVTDVAGNIGYYTTQAFNLDTTPPVINMTLPTGTPKSIGTIGVDINDVGGMLGSISYIWYDESDNQVDTGTLTGITGTGNNHKDISYAPLLDGLYKLKVEATDIAGNTNIKTSDLIYIDKSSPEISVQPENTNQQKKSYDITISATDLNGDNEDGSVQYIEYCWDNGVDTPSWVHVDSNTTSFSYNNQNQSGNSILRIKAADNAGTSDTANIKEVSYTFSFDNSGPTIIMNSSGFHSTGRDISIDINAGDAINGLDSVKYAFRNNNIEDETGDDWVLTDAESTVTMNNDNGDFYIHVIAKDNLGNISYEISPVFTLDNTGPTGSINVLEEKTNNDTVTVEMSAAEDNVSYQLLEDLVNYNVDNFVPIVAGTTYTFQNTNEGTKTLYAIIKDIYGNESQVSDTFILDKTLPSAEVAYDNTDDTNGSVTASIINLSDDVSTSDKLTVNTLTHTFNENGSFDFTVTDEAGNIKTITATVTWIDTDKPTVNFLPNTDTNYTKTKEVVIESSKSGRTVSQEYRIIDETQAELKPYTAFNDGDTILLNKDVPVYIEVHAVDDLGNEVIKKSGIYNTDNIPPVANIIYSTTTRTANDVTATINFNESATITNNSGSNTYTFTENGSFTFEFEDIAGNTTSAVATVDYIDRSIPSAIITLSDTNVTTGPITVCVSVENLPTAKLGEATFDDELIMPVTTGSRIVLGKDLVYKSEYSIDKNGMLSVEVIDAQTGISEYSTINITNIDTEPPTFSYSLSNTERTRDDINVTIHYSDALSEPVTILSEPIEPVDGIYTFTQNGNYNFLLSDALGKTANYTVKINNIDREINPKISYDTSTFTNKDVVATVYSDDEDIFVSNNYNSDTYIFTQNGEFTFDVYDFAGNTATITAKVDWIDKIGSTYNVVPSNKEKTNQPITLTIEPSDKIASVVCEGLIPDDGTINSFTITENGKYKFTVTDYYGNKKDVYYYVGNVDMTPPALNYTLGLNTATGRTYLDEGQEITDVSSSILIDFSDEEKYDFISYDPSLVYDAGTHSFVAYANGEYHFTAKDIAGNESSKTVILTGIDNEIPNVTVSYSTTEMTNKPVVAYVSCDKDILIINNDGKPYRVFTENGTYTFSVSDLAGNTTEVQAVVNNIDKTPPTISFEYSTLEKTNQDVIVTLTSDEIFYVISNNITEVPLGQGYTYTFNSNHTAFFNVKDVAGNETVVFATVSNIDKEAPNILFDSDMPLFVTQGDDTYDFNKGVYSDSLDVDKIEVDTSGVDINTVGTYEAVYTIYDKAGNTNIRERRVDVLSTDDYVLTRINGVNPDDTNYIEAQNISIDLFNVQDAARIYYLPYKTSSTSVKQIGYRAYDNAINVTESGWYSILIYDKDFNTKFYQIFVTK